MYLYLYLYICIYVYVYVKVYVCVYTHGRTHIQKQKPVRRAPLRSSSDSEVPKSMR